MSIRVSFRATALASCLVAGCLAATPVLTPARAQTASPAPHKAFVLIEYQIRDEPLFKKLREKVLASLKTYNGDIVTREKVAPIFGSNPTNLSIIGFPSIDAARSWLASKDVTALASEREKAAQVSTYLVEKLD